jgi:small subunit ribosomal protein S17
MKEHRKKLVGIVTSDKMDRTVVVAVETTKRHPIYGKVMRLVKKYKAHDERDECQVGDRVEIIESRPYSKTKTWAVTSVLSKAE